MATLATHSATPPLPEGEETFRDGLGIRRLVLDEATGDRAERLYVVQTLARHVAALEERTARLGNFRHARFARLRGVEADKKSGEVWIAAEHVDGVRLYDLLRWAEQGRLLIDVNTVLQIARDILPALATLHDSRSVSHGALGPERIVLTRQARLTIVDHGFGAALAKLAYPRTRLWREFRVPMPPSAGVPRFDPRADVAMVAMTVLAALLGRPIALNEFPDHTRELLDAARERTVSGPERPLSASLRAWFERALPVDTRKPLATALEAQVALDEAIKKERAYAPGASALKHFGERVAPLVAAALGSAPVAEPTADAPQERAPRASTRSTGGGRGSAAKRAAARPTPEDEEAAEIAFLEKEIARLAAEEAKRSHEAASTPPPAMVADAAPVEAVAEQPTTEAAPLDPAALRPAAPSDTARLGAPVDAVVTGDEVAFCEVIAEVPLRLDDRHAVEFSQFGLDVELDAAAALNPLADDLSNGAEEIDASVLGLELDGLDAALEPPPIDAASITTELVAAAATPAAETVEREPEIDAETLAALDMIDALEAAADAPPALAIVPDPPAAGEFAGETSLEEEMEALAAPEVRVRRDAPPSRPVLRLVLPVVAPPPSDDDETGAPTPEGRTENLDAPQPGALEPAAEGWALTPPPLLDAVADPVVVEEPARDLDTLWLDFGLMHASRLLAASASSAAALPASRAATVSLVAAAAAATPETLARAVMPLPRVLRESGSTREAARRRRRRTAVRPSLPPRIGAEPAPMTVRPPQTVLSALTAAGVAPLSLTLAPARARRRAVMQQALPARISSANVALAACERSRTLTSAPLMLVPALPLGILRQRWVGDDAGRNPAEAEAREEPPVVASCESRVASIDEPMAAPAEATGIAANPAEAGSHESEAVAANPAEAEAREELPVVASCGSRVASIDEPMAAPAEATGIASNPAEAGSHESEAVAANPAEDEAREEPTVVASCESRVASIDEPMGAPAEARGIASNPAEAGSHESEAVAANPAEAEAREEPPVVASCESRVASIDEPMAAPAEARDIAANPAEAGSHESETVAANPAAAKPHFVPGEGLVLEVAHLDTSSLLPMPAAQDAAAPSAEETASRSDADADAAPRDEERELQALIAALREVEDAEARATTATSARRALALISATEPAQTPAVSLAQNADAVAEASASEPPTLPAAAEPLAGEVPDALAAASEDALPKVAATEPVPAAPSPTAAPTMAQPADEAQPSRKRSRKKKGRGRTPAAPVVPTAESAPTPPPQPPAEAPVERRRQGWSVIVGRPGETLPVSEGAPTDRRERRGRGDTAESSVFDASLPTYAPWLTGEPLPPGAAEATAPPESGDANGGSVYAADPPPPPPLAAPAPAPVAESPAIRVAEPVNWKAAPPPPVPAANAQTTSIRVAEPINWKTAAAVDPVSTRPASSTVVREALPPAAAQNPSRKTGVTNTGPLLDPAVTPAPAPPPSRRRYLIAASIAVLLVAGSGAALWIGRPADAGTHEPKGPTVTEAPAPQPPAAGALKVTSTPTGARVLVDGAVRGVTPVVIQDVSPGTHTIAVHGTGGVVKRTVKVEPGVTMDVDASIFSGWLKVFAAFEVEIYEDGRKLGQDQDGRLLLPPGTHALEFVNAQLNVRQTRRVDISPGGTATVSLEAPGGTILVEAPDGTEILVDGERKGTMPMGAVAVQVGTRTVVLRHRQLGDRSENVNVLAGTPARVSFFTTR